MLEITKSYIFDDQNRPLAVQIPIEVFTRIEEILENHGLSVVIDETKDKVGTVKVSVFQDLCGILTARQSISVEDMDNIILMRSKEELHDRD